MDLKKNAPQISIKLIRSLLIVLFVSVICVRTETDSLCFRNDKRVNKLVKLLDNFLSRDSIQLVDGIVIKKYKNQIISSSDRYSNSDSSSSDQILNQSNKYVFQIANRSNSVGGNECSDFDDYVFQRLGDFFSEKVIDIRIPLVFDRSIASANSESARVFSKSPFLTGFGLGFLAFGLKKLLLPLFIGAQIVKSILIAMFLPSILGSVGKLVGKGVSTFASSSGSSGLGGAGGGGDSISDFDFKDTGASGTSNANTNSFGDSESAGSDAGYNGVWTFPDKNPASSGTINSIYRKPAGSFAPIATSGYGASQTNANNFVSSFGSDTYPSKSTSSKYSSKFNSDLNKTKYGINESFYTKDKQQDFKVFQNIPSSSQLLANYDPFYSPLLSRIDAVFKTLGYTVESCREKLVCYMYKNPAKYAPYSNLISAQLSRELNELRKPSTDNPEILRFFRYMKAAKDGQDGSECDLIYPGCTVPRAPNDNPPMVSTFNDINKLVHARKLRSRRERT